MRRIPLVLGLLVAVSGCTIAVFDKESFYQQANTKEATVNMNIQRLYACFLQAGVNAGFQFINTKDGYAEWSSTVGGSYMNLVEFRKLNDNTTHVKVYSAPGGSFTIQPEYVWRRVDYCTQPAKSR